MRDGQQIARLLVDPEDPNRLFAAVLGHPYGPNEERGVFLSTDGAKTWNRILYKDPDTGANWANVTPPALNAWAKVSLLDASRFDDHNVYAAINKIHLDDLRGYAFRTHDDGKTWKLIADGLPIGAVVNAIREDPVTPHLLYAGTEIGVFVSFNDGDH